MTVDNQRSSLEQKINGFKPRKAVDAGGNKDDRRSFWEDGQTTETGEDQCKNQLHQTGQLFSRGANTMLQAELKEEFGKLSERLRSVLDSNEDYRIGLEADIKETDEIAELDEQQEADIKTTIKDTESKMEEVKVIVQTNLWERYGKNELKRVILEAEEVIDKTNNVQVKSETLEGYEVLLGLLDEKISLTLSAMSVWERWIIKG